MSSGFMSVPVAECAGSISFWFANGFPSVEAPYALAEDSTEGNVGIGRKALLGARVENGFGSAEVNR